MQRFTFFFLIFAGSTVFGNPAQPAVISGEASFDLNGQILQVTTGDRTIIDWNSFSILAGETTRFVQPSSLSAVLNRVIGPEMSALMGKLEANGAIYLINPQGVVIGADARIDVGSFLTSTFDLSNELFLSGQDLEFAGDSNAPITNYGEIYTRDGSTTLIAFEVRNMGRIEAVQIRPTDSRLLSIRLNGENKTIANLQSKLDTGAHPYSFGIRHAEEADALTLTSQGGEILLVAEGGRLENEGNLIAKGSKIEMLATGEFPLIQEGLLDVSSGRIELYGSKYLNTGTLSADSSGRIEIHTLGPHIETASSKTDAKGGSIYCSTGRLFSSGQFSAKEITLLGEDIALVAAHLDTTEQGEIFVGENREGIVYSHSAYLNPYTTYIGKMTLAGFDAKQIMAVCSGSPSSNGCMQGQGEFIDPNSGGGTGFGSSVAALSTGNVAITKPGDNFSAVNAGAVYLYNGNTTALISVIRGSTTGDQIGRRGITTLTNGNFVFESDLWNNGAGAANSQWGAATFVNGTTGISGTVGIGNSLIGSTQNDNVGQGGITALTNGNYVVSSPNWNNGAIVDAGAVTWGNGTTGTSGSVTSLNSLVGTTASDAVGNVTALLVNGNYVVTTPFWNNTVGPVADVGAATWCNGNGGTVGAINATNSLIGSSANSNVGSSGVRALTNGNYVVRSPSWDNGAGGVNANWGAATWGNGTTGISGIVTSANSLIGSTASDQVSSGGVTALSNGNYVVVSPGWDNPVGPVSNIGAVTWGDGTTGITGSVTTANSLVGTTVNDVVGSDGVFALTGNGNYVVASTAWDNTVGPVINVGAVTWGNGLGGTVGSVTAANSLIGGTANDQIGTSVAVLTNGNYVVASTIWDNPVGPVVNVGAATWCSGAAATSAVVTAANSLIGSTANDQVGQGTIKPLLNGNYVVTSPSWQNGVPGSNVGAATWGNGASGTVGTVSAANSFIGSTANDQVGGFGNVTALSNGNYVVGSPNWDGTFVDQGAATWGNGAGGSAGAVSAANSLVGTAANDQIMSGNALSVGTGCYVVISPSWDNGVLNSAGAVTFGNASSGSSGPVLATDSIAGLAAAAGLGGAIYDTVNNTVIARFTTEGSGKVRVACLPTTTPTPSPTPASIAAGTIGRGVRDYLLALSEAPQDWSEMKYGGYLGEEIYPPYYTYKRRNERIPSLVKIPYANQEIIE